MGDEDDGQTQLFLQIVQQVDDLCLHGNVQRGNRLVGDDELRLHHQCTGDADALTLTAGELMGIAAGMLVGQAHLVQHIQHQRLALGGVRHAVVLQTLRHDLLHRHTGVQRVDGVLEDHGHIVRQEVAQLLIHGAGDVTAHEGHLTGGGVIQTDDGTAGGGLAAAGLAHQTEGLALVHLEGVVIDGVHRYLPATLTGHEGHLQVLYLKDRRTFVFHLCASFMRSILARSTSGMGSSGALGCSAQVAA